MTVEDMNSKHEEENAEVLNSFVSQLKADEDFAALVEEGFSSIKRLHTSQPRVVRC